MRLESAQGLREQLVIELIVPFTASEAFAVGAAARLGSEGTSLHRNRSNALRLTYADAIRRVSKHLRATLLF